MLLDERNELADAASIIGAAGAAFVNVGDTIDLRGGVAPHGVSGEGDNITLDLGPSDIFLVVTAQTSIITGGAAGTVTFRIVSDSTGTPDVSTASVHFTTKAFVTDGDDANELDAGATIIAIRLPTTNVPYERFLGIQVLRTTTDLTGGSINAFLTTDARRFRFYADAINGPVD